MVPPESHSLFLSDSHICFSLKVRFILNNDRLVSPKCWKLSSHSSHIFFFQRELIIFQAQFEYIPNRLSAAKPALYIPLDQAVAGALCVWGWVDEYVSVCVLMGGVHEMCQFLETGKHIVGVDAASASESAGMLFR